MVRSRASRSDPFGLSLAEAFGNSLAGSVSFRFPPRPSLDGSLLLPANFAHDSMAPLWSAPRSLRVGEREEGKEDAMGFLRLFMNYGLVGAVLVWAAVVGMMAYHLNESPWRWAFAALSVGGLVTVAGIFWIRKYIDGMNKTSDQGSKS